MLRQKIVNKRFASRIEREIHNLVSSEGFVLLDIAKAAGVDRAIFARIQRGRSLHATNAEAILNAMGYQLTITKIEGENEDAP